MLYDASPPSNWITVRCPVCCNDLGYKMKDEIKSFICKTEGCSKTQHTFYPGHATKPGKSKPWFSYYHKKNNCGCGRCEATPPKDGSEA